MGAATGNPKGVRIILAVLLTLMALGAAGLCSRAKAQDARTGEGLSMSLGTVVAGSARCFTGFLLAQEFSQRRWLGYLATHGNSGACIDGEPMRANIGAGIIRATQLGKWSFGFGIGAYEHGDIAIGPDELEDESAPRVANRTQLVAAILIRRLVLRDRVVIDLLHNSSGGSTAFNYALNYVALGLRF